MKRIALVVLGFLAFACHQPETLQTERIEGPFLILSTPYNTDGSVNYENLVAEARFASSWDTPGIIWPQSNDANDLLTREERFAGMAALVAEWKEHPVKTVLTLGVNGDDTEEMLVYAVEAERLAAESGVDIALCARPPYYGGAEEQREYYEALAGVATHPVIIQTYVNDNTPTMSVEFMADLARRYPQTYGWIKEESNNLEANDRQKAELESGAIKTVFSAWGGWQWLYQRRQIGTRGLISEKIAYAPITNCVWEMMKDGDKEGHLTEAYAMYRLVIDQRFLVADGLRGYQLHYFQRLGLFDTMVSRVYACEPDAPNKTYTRENKSKWVLRNEEFTPEQIAELDKCYDDMIIFANKYRKK
ncbi:MAG: dihydrodipicolinate synthase family protein [Bacteroidales bacterium]|nr:dihydrodipicolinate synthase family protein [Bacteroidales bacterium]